MNERQSNFSKEVAIIPEWVKFLAGAVFICVQLVFVAIHHHGGHHGHDLPPLPVWTLLGIVGGAVMACWVLLLGYVNRDSARRAMSPTLWTLICIFVPNCLGFLIYFLIRKPFGQYCPNCHAEIDGGFRFCPRCGYAVSPACTSCGRAISRDYVCCPYCGQSTAAGIPPVVPPPAAPAQG